jgi:hypothetical protein
MCSFVTFRNVGALRFFLCLGSDVIFFRSRLFAIGSCHNAPGNSQPKSLRQ